MGEGRALTNHTCATGAASSTWPSLRRRPRRCSGGGGWAVQQRPAGAGSWLFPRLARRLRYGGWLDSQSAPRPGEPDRRCDTIMGLVDEREMAPPWACVIELFTEADADAVDRTLE